MKVISGTLKGRKIDGYLIPGTRPTMDRVKESLFAMLQNDTKDSVVLDLFAGSGSLGIEAISNGAKKGFFVDHNKKCTESIKKNVEVFNIKEYVDIRCMDYKQALHEFTEEELTFDLIFLDPPYKNEDLPEIISYIMENNLLKQEGKIICEIDNRNLIKEYENLIIWKDKKYADKYIIIYLKQV